MLKKTIDILNNVEKFHTFAVSKEAHVGWRIEDILNGVY